MFGKFVDSSSKYSCVHKNRDRHSSIFVLGDKGKAAAGGCCLNGSRDHHNTIKFTLIINTR
jgi:hypothetical protein